MWWIGLALAAEPGATSVPVEAWIAPGPAELAAALGGLEQRLWRSETVGEAAQRLQNAWGGLRGGGLAHPCEGSADGASVAARIFVFGTTWRDDVQSVRAEADRLVAVAEAPTVAPLLDPETQKRIDLAQGRAAREVAAYASFHAWHQRFFLPSTRGCAPGLGPAAGVSYRAPEAPEEQSQPVALLGLGGGTVCPAGEPADGRVVVNPGPEACMGGPDCRCEPVPVDPGAVLFGRPPL